MRLKEKYLGSDWKREKNPSSYIEKWLNVQKIKVFENPGVDEKVLQNYNSFVHIYCFGSMKNLRGALKRK